MPRITASRKQLVPDPVYGSLLVSKFVNSLMWDGKKSTAQAVVYGDLNISGSGSRFQALSTNGIIFQSTGRATIGPAFWFCPVIRSPSATKWFAKKSRAGWLLPSKSGIGSGSRPFLRPVMMSTSCCFRLSYWSCTGPRTNRRP